MKTGIQTVSFASSSCFANIWQNSDFPEPPPPYTNKTLSFSSSINLCTSFSTSNTYCSAFSCFPSTGWIPISGTKIVSLYSAASYLAFSFSTFWSSSLESFSITSDWLSLASLLILCYGGRSATASCCSSTLLWNSSSERTFRLSFSSAASKPNFCAFSTFTTA